MNELERIIASLNTRQNEAVKALYGSYMVVAGPGTGKTQVLAARTANILASTDTNPENILITTFTEAWVIALKKRLLSFVGPASYKIRVSTIHSLSKDIIEGYPEYFLKYRAFSLMDELENYELIEEILQSGEYPQLHNVNAPTYWIPDIVKRIKNLRDEAVTPDSFEGHILQMKQQLDEALSEINPERAKKTYASTQERHAKILAQMGELREIYREYFRIKEERGKYDFSDMILYVAEELSRNDILASELAERFQFVMVDEFQDLSNAQNDVIMGILRMSDTPNILTVWDDDQSIYRFQGANLENMLHFSEKFPDTQIIVLEENYRSGQEVLDSAKQLIEQNLTRITKLIPSLEKPLRSPTGRKSQVTVSALPDAQSEQSYVIGRIEWLRDMGIPLSEIAVLVRRNSEIASWTELLESRGIPVTSRQKHDLFRTDEFRLLRYVMEIASLPKVPDISLIELLRIGFFPCDRVSLYRLTKELESMNYRRVNKLGMFDLITSSDTLEALFPDTFAEWKKIAEIILNLRSIPQSDITRAVRSYCEHSWLEKYIREGSGIMGVSRLYKALSEIESMVSSSRVSTIIDILSIWKRMEAYRISLEIPEVESWTKWVQVLTAHQSKGLEYEYVFIPGTLNGVWGNSRNAEKLALPESITWGKIDTSEKNEEERRLFFVAVTRAKTGLDISFPASIRGMAKLPSEFLGELGVEMKHLTPSGEKAEIILPKAASFLDFAFGEADIAYLQNVLSTYRLSPTDLNTFLESPKEFLKRSILRYPFEDNPYFIFWRSYHEALEKFFLEWKKEGKKPTLASLVQTFVVSVSRGYLTPAELTDAKERWEQGLRGWYELQSDDMILPSALEYSFGPKNIVFQEVPLKGKIDRIDLLPDGSLRVTDYKTGGIRSLNDLLGNGANSDGGYYRQLMMYRLMLSLDPQWSKYPVTELCVDFVEGKDGIYRSVPLPIDPEKEETLKTEILDSWEKIRNPEWWIEYLKTEA